MSKKPNSMKSCACGNEVRKGGTKCEVCHKKDWRERNPIKQVFNNLKSNAKTSGVGFFLTFEEFARFIVDTEYMTRRGKNPDSLSIDRMNPKLGYRDGNLQILTLSDNVKKYKRGECWTPVKQSKEDSGTPF
jgi:hypothetical protein